MADGFTFQVDDDLARTIEKRAAEAGMSRDDYMRDLLVQQTFRYDDFTWLNGDPRDVGDKVVNWDEPGIPWADLKAELWDQLETALAKDK